MGFFERKPKSLENNEEVREWLKEFIPLYEKTVPIIDKITIIDNKADKASIKTGIDALLGSHDELLLTLNAVKHLTKPKERDLGKLRANFEDALKACISASQIMIEATHKQGLGRSEYAKLVYFTSMAKGIMQKVNKTIISVSPYGENM
jgi:hypothetical protein